MTTTVKGAGRARHESNRRHQQNTPLPPKGATQKSPADLATEDAERTTEVKAELGASQKAARTRAMKREHAKGAHDQGYLAECPVCVEQSRPAPEDTAPAAGAKRAGKSTASKKASAGAPPAEFPGAAKAVRLLDGAAEAGWEAAWGLFPPATIVVTVSRGPEKIVTTLTDNKLDLSEMPAYNDGSRTVKLKNVSAVLAQMSGAKPAVKPAAERAARAPRRTKAEIATEDGGKALPFDPATATDEEIVEAVRGRAIEWMNGISRKVEEAVVSATRQVKNPKYKAGNGQPEYVDRPSRIEIAQHPSRPTRTVSFVDPTGGGHRAVALDRLTRIK